MVIYNCNICSFNTSIKTHYERHLKTKKHLAKEKETNCEKIKSLDTNLDKYPDMNPDP